MMPQRKQPMRGRRTPGFGGEAKMASYVCMGSVIFFAEAEDLGVVCLAMIFCAVGYGWIILETVMGFRRMDEKKIEHPTAFSNIIPLARENKLRMEKTRYFV